MRITAKVSLPEISYNPLGPTKEKTGQRKRFTRDPQATLFSKHFIANANSNHGYYKLRTVAQQRNWRRDLVGKSIGKISLLSLASLLWAVTPAATDDLTAPVVGIGPREDMAVVVRDTRLVARHHIPLESLVADVLLFSDSPQQPPAFL
ncbi:hypothetical protein MUK42_15554 [Musa troglodytarum]|uniref:Uncharacterized protein n=1 Tax=Musa troglodytarum TaxID=320322 RepID=A0A9E7HTY4_9LILI|nr:hypothetical protein MUK42_15554 [Musa troglodytarum]